MWIKRHHLITREEIAERYSDQFELITINGQPVYKPADYADDDLKHFVKTIQQKYKKEENEFLYDYIYESFEECSRTRYPNGVNPMCDYEEFLDWGYQFNEYVNKYLKENEKILFDNFADLINEADQKTIEDILYSAIDDFCVEVTEEVRSFVYSAFLRVTDFDEDDVCIIDDEDEDDEDDW